MSLTYPSRQSIDDYTDAWSEAFCRLNLRGGAIRVSVRQEDQRASRGELRIDRGIWRPWAHCTRQVCLRTRNRQTCLYVGVGVRSALTGIVMTVLFVYAEQRASERRVSPLVATCEPEKLGADFETGRAAVAERRLAAAFEAVIAAGTPQLARNHGAVAYRHLDRGLHRLVSGRALVVQPSRPSVGCGRIVWSRS